MTDDILARLREGSPCAGDVGCADVLCIEAADEIERLRAEVDRMQAVFIDLNLEIDRKNMALLDIFDYECRANDKSLIACTARSVLWPVETASD